MAISFMDALKPSLGISSPLEVRSLESPSSESPQKFGTHQKLGLVHEGIGICQKLELKLSNDL